MAKDEGTQIRIWRRTLRKLKHLCSLDHRRIPTEEIDWLIDAELGRRGIDPNTLKKVAADRPVAVPASA